MSRNLAHAYLQGEARAFFPRHPGSAADRAESVRAALRPLAPGVADELEAQNRRFAPSAARDRHLAALRHGAAAVITGQQVGLFLGPLYTLYKAASAIRIARGLEAESGIPVVPIFWLQTEDHDLPEIASSTFTSPTGAALRELALPVDDGRISIAHRRLPADVDALVDVLRDELGELPHGAAHVDHLASHYRPGMGWSEAFAGLLAALFADEGLILVDPRTEAIAAAGRPIHRHAIEGAELIARALREQGARLRDEGFAEAVHVREDAPLSFFHPSGPEGPRFRLDASLAEVGGGRRHERAELLSILEAEPLRFSTSALLRPLLQDSLLPTAAYVGGPGELAYFAQLAPVYAAFDRPMPLLAHRARFVVIEPRARRLLRRLGLGSQDAASDEAILLTRCCGAAAPDPAALLASLLDPLEAGIDGAAAPIGPELQQAVQRTRTSIRIALQRFARRYEAVCLRRDQALVDDVRKLQRLLHPAGGPQERLHGYSQYAARYGERAFIESILARATPFDASLQELEP